MNFQNYTNRIHFLNDNEEMNAAPSEKQNQNLLQVKKSKMLMTSIIKSKFAKLNDK